MFAEVRQHRRRNKRTPAAPEVLLSRNAKGGRQGGGASSLCWILQRLDVKVRQRRPESLFLGLLGLGRAIQLQFFHAVADVGFLIVLRPGSGLELVEAGLYAVEFADDAIECPTATVVITFMLAQPGRGQPHGSHRG